MTGQAGTTDSVAEFQAQARIMRAHESQAHMIMRRFLQHKLAVAGVILILVLLVVAALAPLISPADPLRISMRARFTPPMENGFLLGTDEMGRDLVSRLLYAGRISLVVGFAAMFVTVVVGSLVGAVAGYYGGWVDMIIMRITDILLCFPTVFLLLVLAAFIQPTVVTIALIIGFTAWMEVARIVHSQVISLKQQDFILAAKTIGASGPHVIFRQLMPNAMAPILVAATLNVANAVLMESYISYLGYGIQPPTASWGNMLTNAQAYFDTAPWLMILPGTLITITVMSFNFFGDGLRDALDPRLKIG